MLRFSILISNYNHGRLVGAAVESCLAQDFAAERFEIVVVDDGSTDDSLRALARFRDHPQVRIIEQANAGQAAAFATALAASSGELICLLDPDDLFEPGKLSALDAAMGGADDGLLCHDLEVFNDADGATLVRWWQHAGVPRVADILTPEHLLDSPHPFPFSVPCGLACGRRALERVMQTVSLDAAEWRVAADAVLAWSLFMLGGRVRYLPKILARYRLHSANTYMQLVDGVLQGRRAWQGVWPTLLPHLRAFLAQAALQPQEHSTWEALLSRFQPLVEDMRSIRAGELPDRAAVVEWAQELLASSASVAGPGIAEMEAWSRSLLGLAFMGGDAGSAIWQSRRERLARGVDPDAADGWGLPTDRDQRIVELAEIALALCLAPVQLWEPLPDEAKGRLLDYLRAGFGCEVPDNNWLWFRVAIGVALERLGASPERGRMQVDLDRLESYATERGWYRDGPGGPCDYYNAWGFHFYALLYTRLDPKAEAARCARLQSRAASFAREYRHWFAPNGAPLAQGRSLSYRFGAAAFWGVLAWAEVDALPPGELKGMVLRHLRWWKARVAAGPLAIGYSYPNPGVGEFYASPGSSYAAAKGFAALLMPASHAFWSRAELPQRALGLGPQSDPGLLLWRSDFGGHVSALCAGAASTLLRAYRPGAYSRFCYSTHFGFGLEEQSFDSALALSRDGATWRWRARSEHWEVKATYVYAQWRPWPEVLVRTWLVPADAWHVRIHAIQSPYALHSAEGGFALGYAGALERKVLGGEAFARSDAGSAGAIELAGARQAELIAEPPAANLMHPQTVIPLLRGAHAAGTCWLVGAFLGTRGGARPPPPRAEASGGSHAVFDAAGRVLWRAVAKAAGRA